MIIKNVVLDTSIFVNPDSRCVFGPTPDKALSSFLPLARDSKVNYFMPPSTFEELMKFISVSFSPRQLQYICRKPPASYQTTVPALLFYEFIEEMRNRINKGLRIAEKYTRKGLKQDKEEKELIKTMRDEYRIALREGVLDSKEDFDIILLAQELKATIATSDNGLVLWAAKLGIPAITAQELKLLTCPQE